MSEIPRDPSENRTGPEPEDPLPTVPLTDVEPISDRVQEIQADSSPNTGFGFSPRFGHITRRLRSYRREERGADGLSEQMVAAEIGRRATRPSIDGPRHA